MSLIAELKRRNVIKVGGAYLALAWVVVQLTGTIAPAMHLPDWTVLLVVWIGVIGFPFVVVFSWVFELTPEGLKRESEVDRSQSITQVTSKRLDYIIIALMVLAMLMFAADRFIPRGSDPVVAAGHARDAESSVGAGHARDSESSVGAGHARDAGSSVGAGHARDSGSSVGAGHARDSAADRAQGALPQPTPDDKSIAVLPFADMSQAKDQEYFSDGISEELLNLLAKIPELKVIARTSSFAFKGKEVSIAEIARTLNVAHVLEGSVRKSGNTIRITTQLVRASDSTHLWSETYDRPLDNIFAVQDEIAGAVVEQLKIKLLGAAPKAKAVDAKAYALYLQARQLERQGTPEGFQQAISLYQQALEVDRGYAQAWSGLAATYNIQTDLALRPFAEGYALAREAATSALAIDPDSALAHANLGNVAMNFDSDFAASAQHFQRALELEPANPEIIGSAAFLARALGQLHKAVGLREYARTLDPVSASGQVQLGVDYIDAGRLDDAIASLKIAVRLSPGYSSAQYRIGQALLLKGELAAALAAMRLESNESWRMLGIPMVHHALGQRAESDAALAALIEKYSNQMSYNIAYALAYRGEAGRAFEWLDKAIAYRDPGLADLPVEPLFTNIREDPRWLPFLRKLGKAPEQLAAIRFDVKVPGQ